MEEWAQQTLLILAGLTTVLVFYDKAFVQPRKEKEREELIAKEKRDNELQESWVQKRTEERNRQAEIDRLQHEETISTMKKMFKPHIENIEENTVKIQKIEGKYRDQDGRIVNLEKIHKIERGG